MFRFENIYKEFRGHFWEKTFLALDNVSFSVKRGEIIGFLGANGAGKTTSIKMLMGFITPTSGIINYDESLGNSPVERLSNIGYFPERPFFYPHLTGREFIFYLGRLNKTAYTDIESRLKMWADRLKLSFALDRKIRSYSKGMLQRLGFMSALIHDPELIILDEPLSGLDPVGRKEFKDTLSFLAEQGKTIFFSSHIISDIEEICKKVVVLDAGKLMYEGSIADLIERDKTANVTIKIQLEGPVNESLVIKSERVDNVDHIYECEVEKTKENDFLKDVIDKNGKIIFLGTLNPSLEDIIYRVKK